MTDLFALLIGHAVADFALQSDSMARGKNRHRLTEGPPGQTRQTVWPYWLAAHALVHAGAVWVITGSWELAAVEYGLHVLIDFAEATARAATA